MPKPKGALKEIIKEKKCSKCGKNFVVAIEHRYKEGSKFTALGLAITTDTIKSKNDYTERKFFENGSEK